MRSLLRICAGAFFSLAFFTFADGFITAKTIGTPYNFLMWLPSILIITGMFVFNFVDAKAIAEVDFSIEDSNAPREKILFFIGTLLILAGFAVAMWKAIDPYANIGNSWPGISLVIQSILLGLSTGLLFFGRIHSENDWE